MTFDTPITVLPFVGSKYAKLLDKLGITTVGELLYHIPRRYVDLSKITSVNNLILDETQVISVVLQEVKKVRLRGGKVLVTATGSDDSGIIQLSWFNQPYMEKSLQVGKEYRFAGEPEFKFGKVQMLNPQSELASNPPIHTGRLVPVYAQTAGVSSKWLRARLAPLLSKTESITPEFLPKETIARNELQQLPSAISHLHAPESSIEAAKARHRLAFDELLLLQLHAEERKSQWQDGREAPQISLSNENHTKLLSTLPFTLTNAQHKAIEDILQDMASVKPMNRLLEGDVGSGKTVVAFVAAVAALWSGHEVAVMAPTSVLAQQLYQTFKSLAESLHGALGKPEGITLALRTSKSKMNPADITIGTHALIADGVSFSNLGLVIIDEQHRFGVEQRAALMAKSSQGVHVLTMTATPIPRTLALTAYGDLSLTIIDQLPSGRLPIRTHIVPDRKRTDMYTFIKSALDRGEQAYVICPLIESSESLQSVRDATSEFERLTSVFPKHKLGLLHGRMKPAEKDGILNGFKEHQFDLLVATPVVEVGIDVPNATIILIEGAERFGLAQLHQLRGRVGRGAVQSYCFLLSDSKEAEDIGRLQHLEHEHSGIRLAEIDLQTRGPGEVYGIRQSGLPELKAASFFDVDLLEAAKKEASLLWREGIESHPKLHNKLKTEVKAVELN